MKIYITRFLFFLPMWFFAQQLWAHNVSVVYFKVHENDDEVLITADLPWILKDALENFDSSLKMDKSRANFNRVLKAYAMQKLILWSESGIRIPLKEVREINSDNLHVHGAYLRFVYETEPIAKIENSFFFDINQEQKNITVVKLNGVWKDFKTEVGNRNFDVKHRNIRSRNFFIGALLIGTIVMLSYFRNKK